MGTEYVFDPNKARNVPVEVEDNVSVEVKDTPAKKKLMVVSSEEQTYLLRSINSKLTFFMWLAIIAIVLSIFMR